jgi:hypothetical protein
MRVRAESARNKNVTSQMRENLLRMILFAMYLL